MAAVMARRAPYTEQGPLVGNRSVLPDGQVSIAYHVQPRHGPVSARPAAPAARASVLSRVARDASDRWASSYLDEQHAGLLSHRLSRATLTGSTSASFRRIGPPPCLRSLSMGTVTTCCRSSADVTVPVWPSRADEQTIRTRTPTCTPESSGRGNAASLLADRHVEHVAPDADRAHRKPTVSPRAGRRRWPHSVHPSHSGSSRWTSGIGEERWSLGFLNISFLHETPVSQGRALVQSLPRQPG